MPFKAFKVELDPNDAQQTRFREHAGAARHAWNWGLEHCRKVAATRKEEKERDGIATTEFLMGYDLCNLHYAKVKSVNSWCENVSKSTFQRSLIQLGLAYKRFFTVPGANPPKFKKKGVKTSFFLSHGGRRIVYNPISVNLPKIGRVRTKHSIPAGVVFKSAVISERAGRWFVAAHYKFNLPDPTTASTVVGVDLGVATLATLSTGDKISAPMRLASCEKRIRRLQRQLARRTKDGKRWERTRRLIQVVHYKQSCIRRDACHKLTTRLAKNHGVVVIEDLNVRGMLKNRKLARSVSAANFGEVRRQLTYKCGWYGSRLVVADRFFPSSQLCSGCGGKKGMPLNRRVYDCPACGLKMDRDINAAKNLAALSVAVGNTVSAR